MDTLLSMGMSYRKIGERIGVNASTISRELARNSGSSGYNFAKADDSAVHRKSSASKIPKKMKGALEALIFNGLREDWSPEQISGRLKLQGKFISHEAIYQCVRRDKAAGGPLYQHLRHGGKKYRPASPSVAGVKHIPNRVDISERPTIVEEKSRVGDWEGDTIISHGSRAAIVTLVDRCSKISLIKKIGEKTKKNTIKAVTKKIKSVEKQAHSITFDNGGEFAGHEEIAKKLKTNVYFARPYKSCDRGLNEHTNGLIRQYLPKKSDFVDVSHKKIKEIENKLNNRPRKVLKFKTPFEVFFGYDFFTTDVALHT
jgi:IS30 family transposase